MSSGLLGRRAEREQPFHIRLLGGFRQLFLHSILPRNLGGTTLRRDGNHDSRCLSADGSARGGGCVCARRARSTQRKDTEEHNGLGEQQ